jgi:DNA-binding transcriptional ArsR family regulator
MAAAEHASCGGGISITENRADDNFYKGLSHPIRRAILIELGKGDELAATHLASRFGMDPAERTTGVSYHLKQLAKFGCIEDAGTRKGARSCRFRLFRLNPEYQAIVLALAQREVAGPATEGATQRVEPGIKVEVAASGLRPTASSDELEAIAGYLQADGSPYGCLKAIADVVRSAGIAVTLPGEGESGDGVTQDHGLTPGKLSKMTRLNLRQGLCGCSTSLADGDGYCVNCTKPVAEAAV